MLTSFDTAYAVFADNQKRLIELAHADETVAADDIDDNSGVEAAIEALEALKA